jgi:hypothetical protein
VKTASMTTPFTSTTLPTLLLDDIALSHFFTPADEVQKNASDAGSITSVTKQRH